MGQSVLIQGMYMPTGLWPKHIEGRSISKVLWMWFVPILLVKIKDEAYLLFLALGLWR